MNIQSIINTFYRYPRSQLKTYNKFGGWWVYRQMQLAEKEMARAAQKVEVISPISNLPTLQVSFLTGTRFWHQTVFCAYSLQKVCKHPIHFTFYDDGSLSFIANQIKEQVPNSRIVSIDEIEVNILNKLPKEKYPYLNKKRAVYKHIRKLTDVYTHGEPSWKLMLDSDMLFWKEPKTMIDWLQNPNGPFYILDMETAYGYDLAVMGELANATIKPRINVGALGMHSHYIDFDKLEYWTRYLETHHGTSYYLEQALSAMLIGDKPSTIGSEQEYVVYPTQQQVVNKAGTLHHYVDVSKKWYFNQSWKQIL